MKKLIVMMLSIVAVSFFNCSNNDDEPSLSISKSQITGIWDATAVQFNNDGEWHNITNRPDLALSIYFYEDGYYHGNGALGNGDGTYTLTGNTVKTYVKGELYATYIINSLSDNKAELSMTMGKESMLIQVAKSKISFAPNDPSIIAFVLNGIGQYWLNDNLNGNRLTRTRLQFDDWGLLRANVDDYTIDEKGVNYITVNGKEVRANINSHTSDDYIYSFNGKELVVRNYDTKKEGVCSATIKGNELTLVANSCNIVFTKESESER